MTLFTSENKIRNVNFTTEVHEDTDSSLPEKKTPKTGSDLKTALIYLIISIILACAGAVYEHFSFGVYSYFMIYAFAVPLIGGTLPFMLRYMHRAKTEDDRSIEYTTAEKKHISGELYHAAIAVLTVGSIVQGALAICGRPNSLTAVYLAAAAILLAASAVMRYYGILCFKIYRCTGIDLYRA